jgi:hypothetical protein
VLVLLVVSCVLHAIGLLLFLKYAPEPILGDVPVGVEVVDGDPLDALTADQIARLDALEKQLQKPEEDKKEEEKEEPEPDPNPKGQVVEVPKPNEEKIPAKADYLADHNNSVPEETKTLQYKVNPDVLSNQYSKESKLKFEDLLDVGAKEDSSGATVGSLSDPAPGEGAPHSAIPSPWALTNKEGLAAPSAASSKNQELAGAPQNDLLDEKTSNVTALNTREFIGAAYINRIRRQVNFYWNQNLQNLSSSVRLSNPRYNTVVGVVLNADGALETITVTTTSGSDPLDDCVTSAFRIAGPFPNPPEQLIRRDGRVYLDDLDFEVMLGHAEMPYQGIDPRAGVQFPGILKAPR